MSPQVYVAKPVVTLLEAHASLGTASRTGQLLGYVHKDNIVILVARFDTPESGELGLLPQGITRVGSFAVGSEPKAVPCDADLVTITFQWQRAGAATARETLLRGNSAAQFEVGAMQLLSLPDLVTKRLQNDRVLLRTHFTRKIVFTLAQGEQISVEHYASQVRKFCRQFEMYLTNESNAKTWFFESSGIALNKTTDVGSNGELFDLLTGSCSAQLRDKYTFRPKKQTSADVKSKANKKKSRGGSNSRDQSVWGKQDTKYYLWPEASIQNEGLSCHDVQFLGPLPRDLDQPLDPIAGCSTSPLLQVQPATKPFVWCALDLHLDNLCFVDPHITIDEILRQVQDSLVSRIESCAVAIEERSGEPISSRLFVYQPTYWLPGTGIPISFMAPLDEPISLGSAVRWGTPNPTPPRVIANEVAESMVKRRTDIMEQFGLPMTLPLLRLNCAIIPTLNVATFSMNEPVPNVHRGSYMVAPHGLDLQHHDVKLAQVQGDYLYYHYMMQGEDDKGWGCAYRSLQSIISWFRLNRYTDAPVPSIREIQSQLVAMGVMDSAYSVGCKQWIGSFEVEWVLNKLPCEVECRRIALTSGKEMEEKAREIAAHFELQGTPIMVGGGALAYTLLGVAYNEQTGDVQYLIMDPHYTGENDLSIIQGKKVVLEGYKAIPCGWRTVPDAFTTKSSYNLCLPQRPSVQS